MTYRVTVYGWAIPDDRFRGPGSGTFVDLTYFVDDSVTIGEILNMINQSGFKFIPFRYQGQVVQDKVTIDEIDVGFEPIEEPEGPPEPMGYPEGYSQYPY